MRKSSSSRPQFYDRNGSNTAIGYAASGIAPAGQTQRFSYTVPANRKAVVNSVDLQMYRDAAATTVGQTTFFAIVGSIYSCFAQFYNIAIGSSDKQHTNPQVVLLAGATVVGYTNDGSTGGTVAYFGGVQISEFDA